MYYLKTTTKKGVLSSQYQKMDTEGDNILTDHSDRTGMRVRGRQGEAGVCVSGRRRNTTEDKKRKILYEEEDRKAGKGGCLR